MILGLEASLIYSECVHKMRETLKHLHLLNKAAFRSLKERSLSAVLDDNAIPNRLMLVFPYINRDVVLSPGSPHSSYSDGECAIHKSLPKT